jgi:hypothetical protein
LVVLARLAHLDQQPHQADRPRLTAELFQSLQLAVVMAQVQMVLQVTAHLAVVVTADRTTQRALVQQVTMAVLVSH